MPDKSDVSFSSHSPSKSVKIYGKGMNVMQTTSISQIVSNQGIMGFFYPLILLLIAVYKGRIFSKKMSTNTLNNGTL